MHPLTNEQIWGIPDEELPVEAKKDYFDYENETVIDQPEAPPIESGEASD